MRVRVRVGKVSLPSQNEVFMLHGDEGEGEGKGVPGDVRNRPSKAPRTRVRMRVRVRVRCKLLHRLDVGVYSTRNLRRVRVKVGARERISHVIATEPTIPLTRTLTL